VRPYRDFLVLMFVFGAKMGALSPAPKKQAIYAPKP
jgi:hypothetical protein